MHWESCSEVRRQGPYVGVTGETENSHNMTLRVRKKHEAAEEDGRGRLVSFEVDGSEKSSLTFGQRPEESKGANHVEHSCK